MTARDDPRTDVVPAGVGGFGLSDDISLFDCDAHWTEPADLWSSRAPRSKQDLMPRLERVDGRDVWVLNGEAWATTGSNAIRRGREKIRDGHVMQHYDDIDRSAWSVPDRLSVMDEAGIRYAVVYPNGVGFASNHMFAIEDVAQRTDVLTIYNDFFADLQAESGGRLLPQGLLPIWDMDLTVREMTRLLERGMRGFTLSDKPELLGLPELWEPYFDPMWDLFNESGAVANFHVGSGATKAQMDADRRLTREPPRAEPVAPAQPLSGYTMVAPAWRGLPYQRRLAILALLSFMSNARIIANLCFSDLFDRYPRLKIVSAESGVGWMPFFLEAMDYHLDEVVHERPELAHAAKRPSEYFREHLYAMFWFEEVGPGKLLSEIGVENVLLETDFPHGTCLYPAPREHLAKSLADVPTPDVRRILYENAAELYRVAS